jgi:hypothetical protein
VESNGQQISTLGTPPTTTISNGGGGGAGGNSAGPVFGEASGQSGVEVSANGSCIAITNAALYEDFNFSIAGKSFTAEDNYVGSNYTTLIINNNTYMLNLKAPVEISSSPYATIKLTGTYQSMPRAVSLIVCPSLNTTISVDLSPNPTGITAMGTVPSSLRRFVTITSALAQQEKGTSPLKPAVVVTKQVGQSFVIQTIPGRKSNDLIMLISGFAIIAVVIMFAFKPFTPKKASKKTKRNKSKK